LFVASYKYALLHALADLAILKGDDTGAPLELNNMEIAARFIELHWTQYRPFQAGGAASNLILQQNTGKQAAIIAQVAASQEQCSGSLFRLKRAASDRRTLRQSAGLVRSHRPAQQGRRPPQARRLFRPFGAAGQCARRVRDVAHQHFETRQPAWSATSLHQGRYDN
jgi:hypothetical protein